MKKTAVAVILLFAFTNISAQNNFEGKIIYKLTSPEKGTGNGIIETYFGKQKIRVYVKENELSGRDDLLLDFEKGIVHYINTISKTYKTDSLSNRKKRSMPTLNSSPAGNKIISGYSCSAFSFTDTSKSDFMGDMFFSVWYADSLLFNISDEQKDYEMVPMFTNGTSVGMGMEMGMGKEKKKITMSLVPLSITFQVLPDSIFNISGDYTAQLRLDYDLGETTNSNIDSSAQATVDSVAKLIDSLAREVHQEEKLKKSSKKRSSKTAHSQPIKSPATKPKE